MTCIGRPLMAELVTRVRYWPLRFRTSPAQTRHDWLRKQFV
jgi:hypothetical protein